MTKHRSVLVALAVLFPGAVAIAHGETSPSPKEIMEKVTVTRKLDGSEAVVKMTVTDDKKQSRERDITMATKLYDGGKTEKRIYRFLSPADVQGTSVLVFDYETKADDVWIYLPALRKTRRIGAGERGQTFLGTDFTYEEIRNDARLKSSEMNLAVSAAGEHEGRPCIQSRLHVTSESYAHDLGYNDIDACVDRESWIPTTMKMFGADGKGVKSIELAKLSNVQGTWVPMHREAVSAEGHRTVLETTAVDVVTSIPDDYFTEDGLQRGGH